MNVCLDRAQMLAFKTGSEFSSKKNTPGVDGP